MARINYVKKAQKDQGKCYGCSKEIKTGDSYKWFANLIGRMSMKKKFCESCRIRPSMMTTSDKLSTLYGIQETLEDTIASAETAAEIEQALNDAASEARDVAQEYRDSKENMPDNLQDSPTAQEMEEKADNIESWANELESCASEIDAAEIDSNESEEDECVNCNRPRSEHPVDDKEAEVECDDFEKDRSELEDARSNADSACSNLSI